MPIQLFRRKLSIFDDFLCQRLESQSILDMKKDFLWNFFLRVLRRNSLSLLKHIFMTNWSYENDFSSTAQIMSLAAFTAISQNVY